MLHITNGDSAAGTLAQAGLGGSVLPWRDILHEGPVPAALSAEALRALRARFIADCGWGDYAGVLADFAARDATLAGSRACSEVVLWFEHDLYDQLQLIQLLDWFAQQTPAAPALSLICIEAFPGVADFSGLGQLNAAQLASLFPRRRRVSDAQLRLGAAAWRAFRAPDPTAIETLVGEETTALPFLADALRRHLEQFPAQDDGLNRTERQILGAIRAGARTPVEIFQAEERHEERRFMGDWPVWRYLVGLCAGAEPLAAREDSGAFLAQAGGRPDAAFLAQRLTLTTAGEAVLRGERAWRGAGGAARWLGGVRLGDGAVDWYWDRRARRLVRGKMEPEAGEADETLPADGG